VFFGVSFVGDWILNTRRTVLRKSSCGSGSPTASSTDAIERCKINPRLLLLAPCASVSVTG